MSAAASALPPAGGGAPVSGANAGTSRRVGLPRATLAGGGTELSAPGHFSSVEDWLAAHGSATTEPDWGDLQDEWRTLRDHGYTLARRGNGTLILNGHRTEAALVRDLADRLRAGKCRWQGNGRAA